MRRLSFVVLLFIQAVAFSELGEKRFQDVRELAHQLPKGEKNYFIGIGRSPTPLIAYLQETVGDERAINLPFTRAHGDEFFSGLSQSQQQLIFAHFDKFIPPEFLQSEANLYVMDFVITGDSLMNAAGILKKYMAHKGVHKTFRVIPIAEPSHFKEVKESIIEAGYQVDPVMLKGPKDSLSDIFYQRFDNMAAYGEFLAKTPEKNQPIDPYQISQPYKNLRKEIKQYLAQAPPKGPVSRVCRWILNKLNYR